MAHIDPPEPCPVCGYDLESFTHTAPGYEGLESVHCPACGWEREP